MNPAPIIDDGDLLAYVDGGLDASRHALIERLSAQTPELARKIARLRASQRLPYRAALAGALTPVPPSLAAMVGTSGGPLHHSVGHPAGRSRRGRRAAATSIRAARVAVNL